jgi:excisionase family DNA binding protein
LRETRRLPIDDRDLDDLLTRAEAAALLHVSVHTIDRMIAAGDVDVVRLGSGRGTVRFTRRALLDHVNRKSA